MPCTGSFAIRPAAALGSLRTVNAALDRTSAAGHRPFHVKQEGRLADGVGSASGYSSSFLANQLAILVLRSALLQIDALVAQPDRR